MYVVNFQPTQNDVRLTNSSTGQIIPPVLFYAFKAIANTQNSTMVDLDVFIDFDGVASKQNNIPIVAQTDLPDAILIEGHLKANQSKSSRENFAAGETVFLTAVARKTQQEAKTDRIDVKTEADVLLEVAPRQTLSTTGVAGVQARFFKIPRTAEGYSKGGVIAEIQLRYCYMNIQTFKAYGSQDSPLPDASHHSKAYGSFSETTKINIPYNDSIDVQADFVSIFYDEYTCGIEFKVVYHGDGLQQLDEGRAANLTLANNATKQVAVNLDGSTYFKQRGYLKFGFQATSATGNEKLLYAVTKYQTFGPSGDVAQEDAIAKGELQYQKNQYTLTFRLKGAERLFVTITRQDAGDAASNLTVEFQGGSYAVATPTQSPILQVPSTGQPAIVAYSSTALDDVRISLRSAVGFLVYQCGNFIPSAATLAPPRCQQLSLDGNNQFAILSTDDFMSTGESYLAFVPDKVANDSFRVSFHQNRRLVQGTSQTIKTNGENAYYFTIPIRRQLGPNDSLVAELSDCENCAICFSTKKERPVFDPASPSPENCQMVVGRRIDGATNLFNATSELSDVANATFVHGCIKSLNEVGTTIKVTFKVSTMRRAKPDVEMIDALGWTEDDVGHFGNVSFFRNQHYRFAIPLATVSSAAAFSFAIGPQIGYDQKPIDFDMHAYSVFASVDHVIPTAQKFNWATDNDVGLAVIEFAAADIATIRQKSCDEGKAECYIYVTIQAMRDGSIYSNTSSRLGTLTNGTSQDLIEPLNFYRPTTMYDQPLGSRRVFHFNVLANPMDFVVTPCRGAPVMSSGITDFVYRCYNCNGSALVKEENINVSSSASPGREFKFSIRNSTRWANEADFVFEIGDFSTGSASGAWDAEIFAGSFDPRPSISVTPIEVGHAKGRFQLRFKPATPVGMNSAPQNVEYGAYILAKLPQQLFSPYVACGYRRGGRSLMSEWTVFPAFQDSYVLEGDADIDEYVRGAGTSEFYVAVVARQRDSKATRIYEFATVDMGSLPGALPSLAASSLSGGMIALIVIVCVVVVALLALLTVWCVQRRRVSQMAV